MSWEKNSPRTRVMSNEELPYAANGGDIAYPSYTYECYDKTTGKSTWSTYNVWSSYGTSVKSSCTDLVNERVHGRYNSGGGLDIARIVHLAPPVPIDRVFNYRFSQDRFTGVVRPCFVAEAKGLPQRGVLPNLSFGDVSSYGATGWNKFKPGKPKVDLATAIAELRDFPKLFQVRLKSYKDLGGNYLNYQFGWLPFLSDIRKFCKLTQTFHRELDALRRGNGKWLLREGSVMTESRDLGSWTSSGVCFTPALNYYILKPSSYSASGHSSYERHVWFSGRFRYYIDGIDKDTSLWESGWKRSTLRKLYGLSITPSVLYELMPWSWLIDWFSNAGDVVSNISGGAVDCVAKYAYVMGTTTHTSTQMCTAKLLDNSTISGTVTREAVYKQRTSANPFGFGLTDSSLSVRQLMILAALGIQRS